MNIVTLSNALGLAAGLALGIMALVGAYGAHWLYDNVSHLFGGLFIGGLAAAPPDPMPRAIVAVIIASILWETFEFIAGIKPWGPSFTLGQSWEDTLLDMAMVILGAVGVVWLSDLLAPLLGVPA